MQVPVLPGLVRTIPIVDEVVLICPEESPEPVRVYPKKKATKPVRDFKFQRFNCHRGHPLVEGNIYKSSGKRRCRTCHLNRCMESKIRRAL